MPTKKNHIRLEKIVKVRSPDYKNNVMAMNELGFSMLGSPEAHMDSAHEMFQNSLSHAREVAALNFDRLYSQIVEGKQAPRAPSCSCGKTLEHSGERYFIKEKQVCIDCYFNQPEFDSVGVPHHYGSRGQSPL